MSEEENPQEESVFTRSRRSYIYESGNKDGTNTINRRTVLIIVGIAILVLLVIIAVFASGKKGEQKKVAITPTPTETPAPTDTPTPTPGKGTPTPTPKVSPTPKVTPTGTSSNLNRANLKISVLNGSGVTGAAKEASDVLKKLGYDVVSTGNADNTDYAETTIQVTSAKKAYLDLLKSDLSGNYTIGSATADYTGTDADAVVIIGKK